jgi:hypothetical protein
MSVDGVHLLHGVNFPSGAFLAQLTDATPQANLTDVIGFAAGQPDPQFVGTRMSKFDQPFTSTQLKTVLDLCGAQFAADLSAGNTDFYYKKAKNLGVRESPAGTLHLRLRMASGVAYWTDLSASHGQDATITGRILPLYNGSNPPMVPAGGVALAGTPIAAEWYTLGPVYINSTPIAGLQSVGLSLNLQAFELGSDGDIYSTFCGVARRQPVLNLTSLKADLWSSYGLLGAALTSWAVYFRRHDPDGGIYANNQNQHIAITGTTGKIVPNSTSGGSGDAPSQTSLRALLRSANAVDPPFTIATATTIP